MPNSIFYIIQMPDSLEFLTQLTGYKSITIAQNAKNNDMDSSRINIFFCFA
jgi:hypothetical protein